VLDVGTGTGILAIAAALWGAREVVAVDTDPAAIANAAENVRRNGVADRVRIARGSAEDAGGIFEVAAANLLSSELAQVLPSLPARLAPDGVLIVSGFLREEQGAIRALLDRHGFGPQTWEWSEEWGGLLARRAQTMSASPS
jgi:ribosomal protein L11 methyltransferase